MKSTSNIDTFINSLEKSFHDNANQDIAKKQSAYLKNHFQFFGIQKPLRKLLCKSALKDLSILDESSLVSILDQLWHKEQREFQYTACDIAEKYIKLANAQTIQFFEKLVRTKSWWDTVDTIAANFIGPTMLKYPETKSLTSSWIKDPDMWIRRSALLFQLRYKHNTDENLLFEYCRQTMHEKEFFIRKAIGWSLREYSKTSPESVLQFIDKHRSNLSPLSIREGSRLIISYP